MTKQKFKTYVLPFKGKLFRLALRMLNSRQEAEDTIQDVYLKLWNMRDGLSQYNSLEALAVTVTKNLCIDKLRSYRNRNKNDGALELMNLSTGGRYDPVASIEMDESMQCIHKYIQQLPDRQRLVIQLRDIEQLSYEEIAEQTGLKVNNIRVALSRARKNVRTAYLKEQNYEEGTS
ncbi:RNA polymerase sigma factor [Fodinibius halophilus]|uniref:RNA polymerase sigma factor n=1 Tax=Fodinibius halophilus TaxID=1736908 RepID=A0A6M1T9K6_9BACT|nr:RNA polymerase sigma factor [Fodinibius halophilus]NGP87042.1 RNA polymerase sigma factor [Fodinibius halophilus]